MQQLTKIYQIDDRVRELERLLYNQQNIYPVYVKNGVITETEATELLQILKNQISLLSYGKPNK